MPSWSVPEGLPSSASARTMPSVSSCPIVAREGGGVGQGKAVAAAAAAAVGVKTARSRTRTISRFIHSLLFQSFFSFLVLLFPCAT